MSLNNNHPEYNNFVRDWHKLRTCYRGEDAIKAAGTTYLPYTPGMILDGVARSMDFGNIRYNYYKNRAIYHNYISECISRMLGLMHQKPPTITLPSKMNMMFDKATSQGESLAQVLLRINFEQLLIGRVGILGDFDTNGNPYLSLYNAESIINWDISPAGSLNLIVIKELNWVREEFEWTSEDAYRVLQLGDLNENEEVGVYYYGVFSTAEYDMSQMKTPLYRGEGFGKIPFAFINTMDITTHTTQPPLLSLANTSLSIYKSEADYRQTLYMMGEDTLVITGTMYNTSGYDDDGGLRTGAGARIHLNEGCDAKYIGVDGQGLPEQRLALENDKAVANDMAMKSLFNTESSNESGIATIAKLNNQTASLNQIALSGAAGLQLVLRDLAQWIGEDPNEVVVTANLEFSDYDIKGQEIVYLMTAKNMGAPISKESIHQVLVERGVSKLSYDDELESIQREDEGLFNGDDER